MPTDPAAEGYARLTERLASLAQAVGVAPDAREVCRAVKDFLLESVPCHGLFVSRYDPDRRERTAVYAWSEGREEDVSALPPLPLTTSPNSRAVETGRSIVTDDLQPLISAAPRVDLGFDVDPEPPRSSVAVPLIVQGRVVGGLEVQSTRLADFGPEDANVVRLAANLAAIALENVGLLERERSLRAEAEGSLALLDTLLSASPVALGFVDLGFRYVRINQALADIHGARAADNLGRTVREALPQIADRVEPLYRRVLATREPVRNLELSGETPDRPGETRHWIVNYYPVVDRQDQALGLGIAAVEVTARKRAEEEALRLNATLEVRVAERTAQLAAKTAELEERNAEQETFVYTVSHDLRAPLLALQGMGALLGEAVAAGDAGESAFLLGRISANVEKMGALLNDLLALSRVGRGEDEAGPVDLGEVAAVVLAELEPQLRGRGVAVELPAGWPVVLYPASEAYQVLANLLGNAVKFAGKPGEPPRVRLGWTAEGGRATLRVEDNGPGVAPAYRDRVFGLFQKLDARAAGTGVGLAIVKRIAERHGGDAWVEDSGLAGAAFAVTMPAVDSSVDSSG